MAVAVLLVAAVLMKSLAKVAGDDTGEENGVPQGLARSRFPSCQGLMLKVFPLSAIKIVVVVWQIVYQVRQDIALEGCIDV